VTIDGISDSWFDLLTSYTAWFGITSNYSATINLQDSQITTVPAKPVSACCVFARRYLATASNSGGSSASSAHVVPSPTPIRNCLPVIPSTELDHRLFSASFAELNCPQHHQTSALFFYNHFTRTEYKTSFQTMSLLVLTYSLPRERVYWAVA
jgi:hypothetical protein